MSMTARARVVSNAVAAAACACDGWTTSRAEAESEQVSDFAAAR